MCKLLCCLVAALMLSGCFVDDLIGTGGDDNDSQPAVNYSFDKPGLGNSVGRDNVYGPQ